MVCLHRVTLSSALLALVAAGHALAQNGAQSPWNGAYVSAGGGIGAMKLRQTGDVTPLLGFVATIDNAGDGVFGTAQVGYDFSLNRWFVLGAFADVDFGNVRSVPLVDVAQPGLNDTITWRRSWNVGGRLGVVPWQRTLWYVPFGYTNANVEEHNISINGDQETVSKNLNGWFAGVGVEALVGTNWSTKLEYRYTQLQNSLFYTDAGGNRFFIEPHMHSVRALVSYRFVGSDVPNNAQRPIYKAPPAAPAQPSWTGWYLGAGLGGAVVKFKQTVEQPGIPDTTFSDLGGEGVFGTVQAGVDVQFTPQIVGGVFASYDFGDIKSAPATFSTMPQFNNAIHIHQAWDVGARLGVLASPNALVYVPAGFTQVTVKETNLTQIAQESVSRTINGWFVGLGAETILADNWGLKLEYRYTMLKNTFFADDGAGDLFSLEPREHSARLVLNYRFGQGAMPFAK